MSMKLIDMKIFSDRLKELRINANYTQHQIAEMLGVKQQSYARYENNTGEPTLDTVVKLCEIFDVSSDYLLGISDY